MISWLLRIRYCCSVLSVHLDQRPAHHPIVRLWNLRYHTYEIHGKMEVKQAGVGCHWQLARPLPSMYLPSHNIYGLSMDRCPMDGLGTLVPRYYLSTYRQAGKTILSEGSCCFSLLPPSPFSFAREPKRYRNKISRRTGSWHSAQRGVDHTRGIKSRFERTLSHVALNTSPL